MELVVDASIIFCGFAGKGITKQVLFSNAVKLYSPEYLFDELEEHKPRILELSGLSNEKFDFLLLVIRQIIEILPRSSFDSFLAKANSLISDKDDTEYLALALSLKMPIWSNDSHFSQQPLVQVLNTSEVVEALKNAGYMFSEA